MSRGPKALRCRFCPSARDGILLLSQPFEGPVQNISRSFGNLPLFAWDKSLAESTNQALTCQCVVWRDELNAMRCGGTVSCSVAPLGEEYPH